MISHVGRAYDPLMERFIGQKVVVEMMEGDEAHEHVGLFKAYSADFYRITGCSVSAETVATRLSSRVT